MRYDTILFDADGTLLDFLRSEREAVSDTMRCFGIEPSDELVRSYSEINDGLWKRLERGEIEKEVLIYHRFELFCERHGFAADAKKMSKCYESCLAEKGYFLDGAEELCLKLAGRVRMYIVTNGLESVQKKRYILCGMDRFMSGHFISGQIGYEKPSLRYFESVAAAIPDFCRERTLIVGDSLTSDIRGGIAFGLDTCWYNPRKKDAPADMNITYIASDFDEIYRVITEE